jgi:hypothetical protein
MDTKKFSAMPEQLVTLQNTLAEHGLHVDLSKSNEYKDTKWDVSWVTEEGTIALSLVKHPFMADRIFWSKLEGVLGQPI